MAEPTYQIGRTVSKKHIDKLFIPVIQLNKINEALKYGVSNVTMAGSYSNDMQFRTNCYIEELNTDLPLPFYDFTARMQLPQLCLFQRPDPKATDYTWLTPFSYCAADPVNKIDPDGMEWEIETTQDENGMNIKIRITGVLLNLSNTKLDMAALNKSIKEQLENVYSFTIEGISVTMSADIKVVESMDDIVVSDHVFTVVDQSSLKENSLASTAGYGIKIGAPVAAQTITGDNQRTIAHELGHSGGLRDVKTDKNDLPIDRPDYNLMTQIVNLGRGVDKNGAILLEPVQINRLVYNYNKTHKIRDMNPYYALTSRVKRIRKSLNNTNR